VKRGTHVGGAPDDVWYTPTSILEVVRQLAGGRIAVDPCWGLGCLTDPVIGVTEADDGLALSWRTLVELAAERHRRERSRRAHAGVWRPVVFCNPPYSSMAPWSRKVVDERNAGCEIVTLSKFESSTEWWDRLVWSSAAAVCAISNRVAHTQPDRTSTVARWPSALTYHGPRVEAFAAAAAELGKVIRV
jgi:hypothetical protein